MIKELIEIKNPCVVCKPLKRTFCIVSCRDYERYLNTQETIIQELIDYNNNNRYR